MRWVKILGCALAVLVVAWAVPIIALNAIENKHAVDPRGLIVDNPRAYPSLKPRKWIDQVASGSEGVYTRSWSSGQVRLLESVHRYGSSISAVYAFSTQDPVFAYERKVQTPLANQPAGLRADQVEIFCADFISTRGFRDKCLAWGAWLRYGQYTVYIAIKNAILSEAEFASITQRADAVANQAFR
jgi:hypothetical protein